MSAITLTDAIKANENGVKALLESRAVLDKQLDDLRGRVGKITDEVNRRIEMGSAMRRVQGLYGESETITFRA